jgi:carboxypeptidase family protein
MRANRKIFMNGCHVRCRFVALLLLAGASTLPGLAAAPNPSAWSQFGRLSGTVTDSKGNPLMGATVFIEGPVLGTAYQTGASGEHVITDSQGEFAVEHLVPGWYSLRVTSPTRLPALRNGIQVEAGQTAQQKFVLSDIFSPLHIQVPSGKVSVSGNEWKWVLRTSATTRPVLRYQEVARTTTTPVKKSKKSTSSDRRLVGMTPGLGRSEALAEDPGMGSVLAYFRQLSDGSDVLVAGSMGAYGPQASSLATSFRNHMVKGDPQELTLVVHQLSFTDGAEFGPGGGHEGLSRAQGVVINYSHTRRLSDSLNLTAGLEVDYLNALRDVAATSPRLKLEYRLAPATFLGLRYGTIRLDDDSGSLVERIGMLNVFPRVALRSNRLRLEELKHAEVSVNRRIGKASQVEIAAYRDYFQNATVWSFGAPVTSAWLMSNLLPNPTSGGLVLNAGDYSSSGLRAAYSLSLGSHLAGALDYAVGEALALNGARPAGSDAMRTPQDILRPDRSQSFGGKVWTRIPISNTQVTTSYQWLQDDRVTAVDPYGQADLQIQPFLGMQIRQPLPSLGFLPARIEAVADFRNLLRQGYVSLPQSEGKPLLLTSAYRTLRGGFSFQF